MKSITTILAGGLLMVGLATTAQATPVLTIGDGIAADLLTISDGSALDASSAPGTVSYSGTVGSYNILVSMGTANPGSMLIDVVSLVQSTAPGYLKIGFTDSFTTGNTGTGYAFNMGGTTTGTVAYQAYYDLTNTPWGTGTLVGSGSTTGGSFAYSSQSQTPAIAPNTDYSLTEFIDITSTGSNQYTSFNATLTPVPEPETLVLLGSGFLALAIYCKRRKNA